MRGRALLLALAAPALLIACGGGGGDGCVEAPDAPPPLVCEPRVEAECAGAVTPVSVPPAVASPGCDLPIGAVRSDAPAGFPMGRTQVRFTATREDGSTLQCDTTVAVVDEQAPTLDCAPARTVVRRAPGDGVGSLAPAASDACGEVTVDVDPIPDGGGAWDVTFTATDGAGLTAECRQSLTVVDLFPPRDLRVVSAAVAGDALDVSLAWEPSPSGDVAGYRVERGPTAEGPFTPLGTVGAEVRTYTDAGMGDDEAHYRVVSIQGELEGGAAGPVRALAVAGSTYDLRDQSVPGVPFDTTLYGVVRHPKDGAAGPFPLVLFLHGNHGICRIPGELVDECGESTDHECPDGRFETVPNAEGYDYLLQTLAAQGHVAVSISGNAMNCREDFIAERVALIRAHLARLAAWSRDGGGPLGGVLAGRIDTSRVALVGHSRGGDAVSSLPESLAADPIDGVAVTRVLAIAPTDFHQPNPLGVAYAVVLPGCDGDLANQLGADIYDRGVPALDPFPRSQVLLIGANHNAFNTEWRNDDDDGTICASSDRLDEAAQRGALEAMLGDFLGATEVGASDLPAYMRAAAPTPGPVIAWAGEALDLRWSHHGPERLVVDDFSGLDAPARNQLGEPNSFDGYILDRLCVADACSPSFVHENQGMILAWQDERGLADFGAGGLDARGYAAITVRAVSRRARINEGREAQDFAVGARDAAGRTARVRVAEVGRLPHLYPARSPLEVLTTIRVPFEELLAREPALDLSAIVSVELEMRTPELPDGSVFVTDVELSD